jgi:hypothetical protein
MMIYNKFKIMGKGMVSIMEKEKVMEIIKIEMLHRYGDFFVSLLTNDKMTFKTSFSIENYDNYYCCKFSAKPFNNDYVIDVISVFDRDGKEIFMQNNTGDKIYPRDKNNIYNFRYQDSGFYKVLHYHYLPSIGKFRIKEISSFMEREINEVNYNFFSYLDNDLLEVFNFKNDLLGDEDRYLLYNVKFMMPLFSFYDIRNENSNFIVTKKIKVDSDIIVLEFIINKEGNIISDIYNLNNNSVYEMGIDGEFNSLDDVCEQAKDDFIRKLKIKNIVNKDD